MREIPPDDPKRHLHRARESEEEDGQDCPDGNASTESNDGVFQGEIPPGYTPSSVKEGT